MRTKTISFTDMKVFLESKEAYLERITTGWKRSDSVPALVGEGAHALAASDEADREGILKEQLEQVPDEERETVERLIREAVANDDNLAENQNIVWRRHERQFSWTDPVTGWTLKAKPDEIALTVEESGGVVLQVAERKTARYLRRKHKDQVFWEGMLVRLQLGYNGPLRLLVRLLGSGTEHTFWHSRKVMDRCLENVRAVIRQIETYLEEQRELGRIDWRLSESKPTPTSGEGLAHRDLSMAIEHATELAA